MANTIVIFDFTGQSTSSLGSVTGTQSYDTAATASSTNPSRSRYPTGQIDVTITGDALAGTYSLSRITDVFGTGVQMSAGPVKGTLFLLRSSTEIRSDCSPPATLDLADADQAAAFTVEEADTGVSNALISYETTSLTQPQFVTHQPAVIPLPDGRPLMLTGGLGLLLARRSRAA